MVSRSEIDLLDIRREFRKNFAKSLYQMIQVKLVFCSQGTQGWLRCHCFHCLFFWERVDVTLCSEIDGSLSSVLTLHCLSGGYFLSKAQGFLPVFTRGDDVVFWDYNYSYTIFRCCIISLFLSGFLIVQCFREGSGSRDITLGLGVWIIMRLKFRSWVVVWNPLQHFQVEKISLWNQSES